MYILGNGCVGIGMPTPTFSNTYKLSVDGSVVATAVVVKAYANWPDYVFTSNYKLRKLQDVKNYVLLNHHLPGIPSQQEIKDNGLNLGDVELALTKKVEELTLYIIQKDQQLNKEKTIIDQQQNQIDVLKAEMKAIETKLSGSK